MAAATVVGGTSTASAATNDGTEAYWDAQPEHVTVSFDRAAIEAYQPRLLWDRYDVADPISYTALYAESPEWDTDVVAGFHEYAQQEGATAQDSHAGDHEPSYVFINSDTGDVQRVVYSGYHWFQASVTRDQIRLVQNDAGGENPVLRRVPPWNHHLPTASGIDRTGRAFPVESMLDSLDAWLVNGMSGSLRVDQPLNPWKMLNAHDWWQDDAMSTIEIWMQQLYVQFGFGNVPNPGETGWSE
ncbi:hypothetical protein C478_07277 [Natrinema thermotolerans DSM 11552]|nr:hypothetical protein C478_07277 [Natrinema thermotolerans DSM 11552]